MRSGVIRGPYRVVAPVVFPEGQWDRIGRAKKAALIAHARAHVPRYANLPAGATWSDIPVLRSEDLRPGLKRDLVDVRVDPAKCHAIPTSGSTGEPAIVVRDRGDDLVGAVIWYRTYRRLGLRLRDQRATLRLVESIDDAPATTLRKLVGLPHPIAIDTKVDTDEQLRRLDDARPQVLYGYPSAFLKIARRIRERGRPVEGVRLIVATGEPLPRRLVGVLRDSFRATVRRAYGNLEAGFVAYDCSQGRYHCNADHVEVETVPSGRPGENLLCVTNLDYRAMALLRVVAGDVVLPIDGPCPCGDSAPPFFEVVGRQNEVLRTHSGELVHPEVLADVLESLGGADLFRIILRAGGVEVLTTDAAAARRVSSTLAMLVGAATDITVKTVPVIPPRRSGKSPIVVSEAA
jgi:phenylacetate-CoA ligase